MDTKHIIPDFEDPLYPFRIMEDQEFMAAYDGHKVFSLPDGMVNLETLIAVWPAVMSRQQKLKMDTKTLLENAEPIHQAAYFLGRALGPKSEAYMKLLTDGENALYIFADPAEPSFAADMQLFEELRRWLNPTSLPLLFALPSVFGAGGWVNMETLIAAWPAVRENYLKQQNQTL